MTVSGFSLTEGYGEMRDKAYAMLQATANLLLFGAVFKTSIGIPLGHLPVVGFVHYHSLRYAYVYLFAPD